MTPIIISKYLIPWDLLYIHSAIVLRELYIPGCLVSVCKILCSGLMWMDFTDITTGNKLNLGEAPPIGPVVISVAGNNRCCL